MGSCKWSYKSPDIGYNYSEGGRGLGFIGFRGYRVLVVLRPWDLGVWGLGFRVCINEDYTYFRTDLTTLPEQVHPCEQRGQARRERSRCCTDLGRLD